MSFVEGASARFVRVGRPSAARRVGWVTAREILHATCLVPGSLSVPAIGSRPGWRIRSDGHGLPPKLLLLRRPVRPGAAVPSSVRTGPVCDVPNQVVEGGTTLADGSSRSTVVTGATSSGISSRVVVSEPSEPAKVAWKRSDPDGNLATTSVQGAVNDPPVIR